MNSFIYRVFCLLLVCCVALLGCSRTRVIDKIGIVHVFGFDQADNGEIIGTVLIPDYRASKEGEKIQYLEEKSVTGALLAPKMATHTSTPVELAKIRVLLFGKKFAEAGIHDMVERFILTPQLGTNVQIAVSTESAKKTLNVFKKEKSFTLSERLQHNMQGQALPRMNLHVFLNRFYGEGMDAYMPLLTIDEKEKVKIEGLGIFKDDQLKLQLDLDQTTLFSFIEHEQTNSTYNIELEEGNRREIITFRAHGSKSHWDWDKKKEQLNLRLRLQVTLNEYPDRFDDQKMKDLTKLKKIIEEQLEKRMDKLLATFKENEVDPLGMGNIARSKDRDWEKESFYARYPTMSTDVKVDLKILHSGLEG